MARSATPFPAPTLDDPLRDDPDGSAAAGTSVEAVTCSVCSSNEADPVACGYDRGAPDTRQPWVYVRCRRCSTVYVNPRPSALPLRDPATRWSEPAEGAWLAARLRRWRAGSRASLARRFAGDGRRRVLQVCCGDGVFLAALERRAPAGWEVLGIDDDANAVRRARARGLRALCAGLADFDSGVERFDLILAFRVLEGDDDPRETCRRMHRLLKPGGAIVIETPDLAGLDRRLFGRGFWAGYSAPRRFQLFEPAGLERMLVDSGFEVCRRESLVGAASWIESLRNWLSACGCPGWLLRFAHRDNPLLLSLFGAIDGVRMLFGGRTSSQRMVARRA